MNDKLMKYSYDGIIILKRNGVITQMNDTAQSILGVDRSFIGKKYVELMGKNNDAKNDAFHQAVLDTLNQDVVKADSVRYFRSADDFSFLSLTVANVDEDIYLTIKDTTQYEEEKQLRFGYTKALVAFLMFVAFWNFITVIWQSYGQSISQGFVSRGMVVLAGITGFYSAKVGGLKLKDLGLSFTSKKRYILMDLIATIIILALMMVAKLIILKVNPNYPFYTDGQFIMWNKYSLGDHALYVASVIGQEILSRGILHESFTRMLPNDEKEIKAILLSSFIFGALHVHVGLTYMIGAMLLLGIFGFIYRKQRSIWGLCIVHFVLGQSLGMLGFVAL